MEYPGSKVAQKSEWLELQGYAIEEFPGNMPTLPSLRFSNNLGRKTLILVGFHLFLACLLSGCGSLPNRHRILRNNPISSYQYSVTDAENIEAETAGNTFIEVLPAAYSKLVPESIASPNALTEATTLTLTDQIDVEDASASDLENDTAQTPGAQPVEHFLSLALSSHPKILAARSRVSAATNVIPQACALPDPMFGNTFWPIQNQALQTAGGRVAHQFQVSQALPWLEKLHTKATIASREVQMAQAEVESIERDIVEMVKLAYFEVWFATQAMSIVEENRELVLQLAEVAEARFAAGGTKQDVLRAQLEADRLDDQLLTLRKQKQQAQADLAALTHQPDSLIPEAQSDLGLSDIPKQLDDLLVLAEQCNPELRALAWEIQRDRAKQRLACLQQFPDLNVGLNYAIISDNNNVLSPVANGHDNISFAFGVTMPIWREKINAGIREAANRTSSSAQRLEAERDAIQGKLRRLMAQADAFVEQRTIYEQRIIPRTEEALALSLTDYRGRRTDFFTLVEIYRELLMHKMQLARIEATLAGTIAQIERAVGQNP